MLDWNDLRFFLAVARTGSMSRAARELRVAQPTVGRRLTAFEQRLGARLVVRSSDGLRLTAAGRGVLAHAERMELEATSAERLAAGRDAGLHGVVRLTTNEWLATRVVGPALAPMLAEHPGLTLELIEDPRHLSLARGEADLALRPSAFPHESIVQRKVGSIAFALYASEDYLARAGAPDLAAGCAGHAVLAMSETLGDAARGWLAELCGAARVITRTSGRESMAAMAAAGAGIAFLPRVVGDATAGLRPIPTPKPLPPRTLWLGMHPDARTIPRVRAVARALAAACLARTRPTGRARDR